MPEIQAREVGCHDTIQGVQEQAQEGRAIEVTPFFTKSSVWPSAMHYHYRDNFKPGSLK
jgi:hypothetical protein